MIAQSRKWRAALTAVLLAAGCGDAVGPITDLPRDLSVAESNLIAADNRFGLKLFREINAHAASNANLFISPLSVAMALGMTYNGAAGTTRDAMRETLEFGGMTLQQVNESYRSVIDLLRGVDPRVDFGIANSIWHHEEFTVEQAFLDGSRRFFDAKVAALDFGSPQAAPTINRWVSDQTNGRIEQIVGNPIDDDLVMFLINAIYFNGNWAAQFDKGRTTPRPFTLANGSQRMVLTMAHDDEVPVRRFGNRTAIGIDLSYGGGAFSMMILLPTNGIGIDSLIGALDAATWADWLADLDSAAAVVFLPKFTLEYEIELKSVLTVLGMQIAFEGRANFTGINSNGALYLSKVKHKTFVKVDEEGTEAAAATSVGVVFDCCGPPEVHIDRPFLFVIHERLSGTILFIGKIMDPSL